MHLPAYELILEHLTLAVAYELSELKKIVLLNIKLNTALNL